MGFKKCRLAVCLESFLFNVLEKKEDNRHSPSGIFDKLLELS